MNDGNVSKEDLIKLRAEIKREGWSKTVLRIFANEPVLAECIGLRYGRVRSVLDAAKLSEPERHLILVEVARMVTETIGITQQAGSRLWEDFLPDLGDDPTEQSGTAGEKHE